MLWYKAAIKKWAIVRLGPGIEPKPYRVSANAQLQNRERPSSRVRVKKLRVSNSLNLDSGSRSRNGLLGSKFTAKWQDDLRWGWVYFMTSLVYTYLITILALLNRYLWIFMVASILTHYTSSINTAVNPEESCQPRIQKHGTRRKLFCFWQKRLDPKVEYQFTSRCPPVLSRSHQMDDDTIAPLDKPAVIEGPRAMDKNQKGSA